MYKKVFFVVSFFCLLHNFAAAEDAAVCKIAKDSMKAQFERGELGFYIPVKSNPNISYFIKIINGSYQRTPIKTVNATEKDTSAKSKNQKTIADFYAEKAAKTQPLDTCSDFKKCYNLAFQPKLDSIYKCDFFRKSDSIMRSYDRQGKGYKNVDFPGGAAALQKFLDKNITLPKDAKPSDTDKMIRVYYSFAVDEKGQLSEFKSIKSNCKACEASVLEAMKKLPAFIPATEAGKPKKVKYVLPYTKAYTKPKE